MSNENFKGCPAIVYDENHTYIAQTIINEHSKDEMRLTVSNPLSGIKQGSRLFLLVLQNATVTDIAGNAGLAYSGMREVSYFNEKQRPGRTAPRYKIDAAASINSVIMDSKKHDLRVPIKVVVNNISSSGFFLTSPPSPFGTGTILGVELNFNGRLVTLLGKIIRYQTNKDGTLGFGCKIVFPET